MSELFKYPGFLYNFANGECSACGESAEIVVARWESPETYTNPVEVCRPCAFAINHVFNRHDDINFPKSSYDTEPSAVGVLIVKERPGDLSTPFDFLSLEAPGIKKALPGVLLETDETPAEAACRALQDTGLSSWVGAMEQLTLCHEPHRGKLVQVFLCRAYSGKLSSRDDVKLAFLPMPMAQHPSAYRGFHLALDQAFLTRVKLQRALSADTPLSAQLSATATKWIESKLDNDDEDDRLRDAYWSSLDWNEQSTCRLVVALQNALKDAQVTPSPTQNFAIAAALASQEVAPKPVQSPAVLSSAVGISREPGAVPDWSSDTEADDSDQIFGGRESGGFVPPRK